MGGGDGPRLVAFRRWLWARLSATTATLVVSEGLVGFSRGRANLLAPQFVAVIRMTCSELGLCHAEVPPATLKKYAAGRGNADKSAMRAAAIGRLRAHREEYASTSRVDAMLEYVARADALTDDQADALWLLWWALDENRGYTKALGEGRRGRG